MAAKTAVTVKTETPFHVGDKVIYTGRHDVNGSSPTGLKYFSLRIGQAYEVRHVNENGFLILDSSPFFADPFDYSPHYFQTYENMGIQEAWNKASAPHRVITIAPDPPSPAPPTAACFWLVWNPCGHAPVKKHFHREAADAEARRLAGCHKGQFFVLEAVGFAERPQVPVVDGVIEDKTDDEGRDV